MRRLFRFMEAALWSAVRVLEESALWNGGLRRPLCSRRQQVPLSKELSNDRI
jgi:hypothetical protein